MARFHYFRWFLAFLLLSLGLATGGLAWLASSESGLQTTGRLLASVTDGQLSLGGLKGRLLGPLSVDELRWRDKDLALSARGVELEWTPSALLDSRLEIGTLRAATLTVDTLTPSTPGPTPLPDDLTLPLAVSIGQLTLDSLIVDGGTPITDIAARLTSDGQHHTIDALALRAGDVSVGGKIALDGRAPFAVRADAEIRGEVEQRPMVLTVEASGTLARLDLSAQARQGVDGQLRTVLTPFAEMPFHTADIDLRDVDPSAWAAGAPRARLDIKAQLQAADEDDKSAEKQSAIASLTARLHLVNHAPGPIDKQHLPLTSLKLRVQPAGEIAGADTALQLDDIALELSGGGTLRGHGRWSGKALTLNLDARRLDAARLATHLIPTRFNGPLELNADAERQHVRLDWADTRGRLKADVQHAGDTVTIKALELSAGDARLEASGRVELSGKQDFAFQGALRRFDPSRFVKTAAARIDADFEAQGRLGPRPVVDAKFTLGDSRYAGLPLGGRGSLSLDWPRLYNLDIALNSGTNRLTANGAFGQPADRLNLSLDAPNLAQLLTPFGVDGSLNGTLAVSGTLEQPSATFKLAAPKLALKNVGNLSGLTMNGNLSAQRDAPLALDLAIKRAEKAGSGEAVEALALHVNGNNRAHRLTLDADLIAAGNAQRQHARLAAEGGLPNIPDDWRWSGQLKELVLGVTGEPSRLALRQPAPLSLAASGWQLGPLALAGKQPEWTGTVNASADTARLLAKVDIDGAQLGRIEGQLQAAMLSPWQLASDSPWQGHLGLNIADLSKLDSLLGEGLELGGKLTGTLTLAGTPAHPNPRGRLEGERLSVHVVEQGMRLTDGQLTADFDDKHLRITRLGFASQLIAVPRALRREIGDAAKRFDTPGRLDVSGELLLDGAAGEDAHIEVRLDRFGAWQAPDQWLAVSGNTRLAWRANSLAVRGDLGIDAGYWQLPPAGMPRLSDDVVIKRPGKPASGTSGAGAFNLDLDVKVDLGDRFMFRGVGVQTWLDGSIRLAARGRDLPRASGTISLRDGRFDAYGQKLDIEHGYLIFQGLLDNPALDVRAMRKGLSVEPGVQVSGTAQRPVVRLVSTPEVPDTAKLAWLLLGHGPESMSGGDAAVLAAAAGGVLGSDAGGVLQKLQNALGVDELGVRQGSIGGDNAPTPTSRFAGSGSGVAGSGSSAASSSDSGSSSEDRVFSVGKRLTNNATLAYEQSLNKAESVVKLTVNLTQRFAIIGRAGTDNAVDVLYTLTFGQPPPRTPARSNASAAKPPVTAPAK